MSPRNIQIKEVVTKFVGANASGSYSIDGSEQISPLKNEAYTNKVIGSRDYVTQSVAVDSKINALVDHGYAATLTGHIL